MTEHGTNDETEGAGDESDATGGTQDPVPGVPKIGHKDQPAMYLSNAGDPDTDGGDNEATPATAEDQTATNEAHTATDGGVSPESESDSAREPSSTDPDAYDPVSIFESGELDLREGADDCYKCTSCDTSCPVAEVDDEFPGPKFQGPEQWRLKRKGDETIDESITDCSNCMRCDSACPSSVPLSQMHNEARGTFVEQQMEKFSVKYVRNRILSNYGTLARLGSTFPRLTNAVMGSRVTQWMNEKVLKITGEREFPAFAEQTFRSWWRERGGAQVENPEKRVAYFHGCYSNYNTPEVGKAMVRVFEHYGYEVLVPPQRCSGTPMFANGMLGDARRAAETNVETLVAAIGEGADVIASCTSCSLSLRQEYPELFDMHGIDELSANTFEALEYLRIYEDVEADLAESSVDDRAFAYHAPCHARNQGLARQAVETFRDVEGVDVEDVGDSCSGISGTYGWKAEKYDTSMKIGAEMFDHMEDADGDVGLTECPTCAMQMEHGTGYEVEHPLQLLETALLEDD